MALQNLFNCFITWILKFNFRDFYTASGSCPYVLESLERALDPNQDGDYSDHLDIINMSLGTSTSGDPNDVMSLAVDNLVGLGVVAVIAAGNNGSSFYKIASPGGSSRKAITVGASFKDDSVWGWSHFSSGGPTIIGTYKPDVVAPGVNICAAQWDSAWQNYQCFDDKHVALSGTSMATPHVSGAVALIKQAHPDWTPD